MSPVPIPRGSCASNSCPTRPGIAYRRGCSHSRRETKHLLRLEAHRWRSRPIPNTGAVFWAYETGELLPVYAASIDRMRSLCKEKKIEGGHFPTYGPTGMLAVSRCGSTNNNTTAMASQSQSVSPPAASSSSSSCDKRCGCLSSRSSGAGGAQLASTKPSISPVQRHTYRTAVHDAGRGVERDWRLWELFFLTHVPYLAVQCSSPICTMHRPGDGALTR